EQYQMWKKDLQTNQGDDPKEQEALARRFGRILGYGTQGVNELLSQNTDFNTLSSYTVKQQLTHLYYANVQEAIDFYEQTIGLNKLDSNQFQISQDASIVLHSHDEAHPEGQTKSTAIALLTDQLPQWYLFVQQQGVPIKYTYKPRDGGPHDGFVAIDPGGYLLEFEQFKQHPENEFFMTILPNAPRIATHFEELNFYGSITWTYHKDMLKMQQFYEEALGFQMVADQGWTKIYQTSPTGFIGLVDECRGMEDYADTKAIELEWKISNLDNFDQYATQNWTSYGYEDRSFMGPEKYLYRINSQ
ncbi:MAG: VOC family protein, partial [Bacteroidota bacterium]